MTRSIQYLMFVAMMFAVPMVTGCGGGSEPTVVGGNDAAQIEAEEAEAENQEEPGEEPGGGGARAADPDNP